MKCPIDQIELVMSERSGVEIDYCPTCRGVWLDRGELDKILDRAAAIAGASVPERPHAPAAPPVAPQLPSPLLSETPRSSAGGYRKYDDGRYDRGQRDFGDERRRDDDHRQSYDKYGRKPYRKKKDNWLGEMFDF
ncbi:zf-TFIIB domain-containing protein [Arthrobacter sp. H5]|uniref:TFIIB-type zinc ribbon-containing protein n=1 Tax=Arthrobacter sp. H5 TaxID=1267973 RepID=UPI00048823C4|nr:zf-TFIIB domain-containing protein [Arthrobacter sp. H5]